MKNSIYLLSLLLPSLVCAGGNPDMVDFPADYKDNFTLYSVQNRGNNKQLAYMYANDIALNSIKDGKAANGSVIVMEVHKALFNADGKPVTGADGLFKTTGLAAIAVMEKRDWDMAYPAADRAGDWGFAFYNGQGQAKENDLNCITCHRPLAGMDYLFTYSRLIQF
ncbi:MAG: cytochrome P460 family protein [Gammaproteobacteria bacterium]